MMRRFAALSLLAVFTLSIGLVGSQSSAAQTTGPSILTSGNANSFSIRREAEPQQPFSVVGPRGAILGLQDGTFEAWIFPWKILSNLRITALMQDYPVPIDVNDQAAVIEVNPDHTTVTFAHANFTVREVLFAPHDSPDGAGVLGYFEVEAVRPMALTIQFSPEMKRMWPATSDDSTSAEWVQDAAGGFYAMHPSFPDHAAAIKIPGAEPGILAPYQERSKTYPAQFIVHYEPKRDAKKIFPLLVVTSDSILDSANSALSIKLSEQQKNIDALYRKNQDYFATLLSHNLTIETPDEEFDNAFAWAEISIDQLKVQTTPGHTETALVAGMDRSADSARPGFGWFFGRDALWTLYAVNSYGDFQLTRNELQFLMKRQSPEGRIIHEWSQTADIVDWNSLPYAFASADATPLLLLAANDYLQVSGDLAFINSNWQNFANAWSFECSHDSDGDGIYENIGTGWVESWLPAMPHQEIYLAALDQQASTAFAELSKATGHNQLAGEAEKRAAHVAQQIEKEYFLPDSDFYAFSRNSDGSTDLSPTIYPAVAAWDGTFNLTHSAGMLTRWASQEFSTDWGTRDLSPSVAFYDPISYHQGSVWPLFTGWVSLSEYRNGRTLSGYAHLMQNADLTWAQNPGHVTELLSGQFFRWLGRSTSHQLWSSAMVITPALRGLFGIEWSAGDNTLTVTPNLPAQWDHANLTNLPLGQSHLGLELRRSGTTLSVRLTGEGANSAHLRSKAPGARIENGELRIPLPAAEVGLAHELPQPGAVTSTLKVLEEQRSQRSLKLRLAAPSASQQEIFLRLNDPRVRLQIDGAEKSPDSARLLIHFPSGAGYVEKSVTLSW